LFRKRCAIATALVSTEFISASAVQAHANRQEPALEEIVITADRQSSFSADLVQAGSFRGARQLDTALTVAVLPRTLLDAQQASSLLDAVRNTAGVTAFLVSPTVYDNISIRGIPVDGRGNYRLNGTLPVINFIDLPLENKERVEVLKGVSTLYYGLSTPSGIVNLVTKRPPAMPFVSMTGTVNSHGQLQAVLDAGATSGPGGARIVAATGSVDLGIERMRGRRNLLSGALHFAPSDRVLLNLDVERISKEVTEPTIWIGPTGRDELLDRLPKLPHPRTNAGSEGFKNRARETNVLGRLRWRATDRWGLTLEAGLSRESRDRTFSLLSLIDPGTGEGSLFAGTSNGQKFENRTWRIDFAGSFRTGAVRHELLLGVTSNRRQQYFPRSTVVVGVDTDLGRAGCLALGLDSGCSQNAYEPTPLPNIGFDVALPYDPNRDTQSRDAGLYAFDRLRLDGDSDWTNVLLGIRKSIYRENVATDVGGRRTTFRDEPLSISAGLIAKARPWASLYASYIEGVESLPPAPNFTVNEGQIPPPGKSRQFETGIKLEPRPGLLFTLAYFNIRRQLAYINSDNRFVSNGLGRYRGWETSLAGEISPDLSLYGSAVLLDATQRLTGDPVIDGNRPENTARRQWSAFAQYRVKKGPPGISVNAGLFHTGARAINPENSLFVPEFTLVDVGGSYEFKLGRAQLVTRLTGSNITRKRYFASTGSNILAYAPPPMVKLSLEASFTARRSRQ